MSSITRYLNENNIDYAVLKGEYDDISYQTESQDFKPDLDIVLACNRTSFIANLKQNNSYQYLEENSFLDVGNNLRIDFYFNTLNVSYYHYLTISDQSFLNKEVSEEEYILYQTLDPLLKFSKYHKRHQFRLNAYFKGKISSEIKGLLKEIIGNSLATRLVKNISNGNFNISKSLIRKCKFRMLFINGNFVKMLQSRIL